jgi:hypothetical protein
VAHGFCEGDCAVKEEKDLDRALFYVAFWPHVRLAAAYRSKVWLKLRTSVRFVDSCLCRSITHESTSQSHPAQAPSTQAQAVLSCNQAHCPAGGYNSHAQTAGRAYNPLGQVAGHPSYSYSSATPWTQAQQRPQPYQFNTRVGQQQCSLSSASGWSPLSGCQAARVSEVLGVWGCAADSRRTVGHRGSRILSKVVESTENTFVLVMGSKRVELARTSPQINRHLFVSSDSFV